MTPGDHTANDLGALLKTLNVDGETFVRRPTSTVVPPGMPLPSGKKALEVLRALPARTGALIDEGPIGKGGMGEVHLATQVALGRKVAVKFLRDDRHSPRDVEALLSEAWLAGSLEHPNIAPVHDLSLDEGGLPVLVMKRIEGKSWAALLKDPAAMAAHAPGRDGFEEHLRIFTQVCNAAHFAHARGIVHRDLKPDNVMVGAFGEVLVVDWGIACSFGPSTQTAGTPAYMAPEMLGRPGDQLTARTDVYLLGAALYELLAGHPPHQGASFAALVEQVLRSQPLLPPEAPPELAQLVRRCLCAKAADRPETALAVRRAVEGFLEHQGSLDLATQSERRLEALLPLLQRPGADVREAFALFSECRFGFQQALREWETNERARAGLERAVKAMARFELSRGAADSAQGLLADLRIPDPELEAAVAAAVAAEAARKQELERLASVERAHDPRTGSLPRAAIAILVGVFWAVATPLAIPLAGLLPGEMLASSPTALLCAVALLLVSTLVKQGRTPLNRQLMRVAVLCLLVQAFGVPLWYLVAGDLGLRTVPFLTGYWALVVGIISVSMLSAVWPSALGYLSAMVVSLKWPHLRYFAGSAANAVLAVNAALIFLRQRRAE